MQKRAAAAKVLAFLGITIVLSLVLAGAVHAATDSQVGVEAAMAALALGLSWAATKLEGRPFATIGFGGSRAARSVGIGVALGIGIVAGSAGAFAAAGWYTAELTIPRPLGSWLVAALALSAFVAVFEETLFRGYALQTLARAFGARSAVAFTGAAFGALHLLNSTPGMPMWLKLLGCTFVAVYGMLAAVLRLATGALWMPIGMHFAWNLLEEFVFGFADSGVASNSAVLHATVRGPVVVTGGAYGPEAGVLMLALACAAAAVVLRWVLRPRAVGAL